MTSTITILSLLVPLVSGISLDSMLDVPVKESSFSLHAEKWEQGHVAPSSTNTDPSANSNQSDVYIRVFDDGQLKSDSSGLFLRAGKILVYSGDNGMVVRDPFVCVSLAEKTVAILERRAKMLRIVSLGEPSSANIKLLNSPRIYRLKQGQELDIAEVGALSTLLKPVNMPDLGYYKNLFRFWPNWLQEYACEKIKDQMLAQEAGNAL